MEGFDVQRFIRERRPGWVDLAELIERAEQGGASSLSLEDARQLGHLYRRASTDLTRARRELVDAAIVDHLNDLVSRSYAHVHQRTDHHRVRRFLLRDFPRLYRREWRAHVMAMLLFFVGAGIGAAVLTFDPSSRAVVMPEQHQGQSPAERVAREEQTGGLDDGDAAASFSSFLFTHNIQVTFLVFAAGLTAGVGSAALLFTNGVPLGALAAQYHQDGEGLFFWAWILPHGIPELTAIFIAGGAGLILGRGILFPGRRRRRDALVHEGSIAAKLVLGAMPILVLAGLIEGTISQMHEPTISYLLKLAFALVAGGALYGYLLFAGRGGDGE